MRITNYGRRAVISSLVVGWVVVLAVAIPSDVFGTDPSPVPRVLKWTVTIPANKFTDEIHAVCLARADTLGSQVGTRAVCYDSFKPDPPPADPPLVFHNPVTHLLSTGSYNESTNLLLLPIFSCIEFVPGFLAVSAIISVTIDKGNGPWAGSEDVIFDDTPPLNCSGETPVSGTLTMTPRGLGDDWDGDGCTDWNELGPNVPTGPLDPFNINDCDPLTDTDGDGCTDFAELGTDPEFGGLRDPWNPYDFYDVAGVDGPPDGTIDLFLDILGVILHYSLDGSPPYTSSTTADRRPGRTAGT